MHKWKTIKHRHSCGLPAKVLHFEGNSSNLDSLSVSWVVSWFCLFLGQRGSDADWKLHASLRTWTLAGIHLRVRKQC
jgi:hypothetical protein